ncbi:MAG: hypothetical protein WCW04_00875 [Candidatus Paceibacterota bacterium]
MIKKKLDDFKLSNKQPLKTAEEPVAVKNISNLSSNNNSKYDFLKKKKIVPSSVQRIPQTPIMPGGKRPFNKTILFFFILSILVGAYYLLSNVFLRADITITPKTKTFNIANEKIAASKKNNVPFEVMIVGDSVYKDVILTSTLTASDKAKGEVTLYNGYSNKAEKIPVGSFISDEKGKTYKTDTTVSIPGYKQDKLKVIIPGQINVGITAFLAGETYNGSPTSFSINSFKGTAKYTKIYGHLKTPLTGGLAGLVYIMDDQEKADILSNSDLFKGELLRKLNASVPPGYILYPDAVNYSYNFTDKIVSKTPNLKLEIKANLSAFLVKESDLSNMIINRLLPDITKGERFEIVDPDLSLLSFNFTNKDQVINKETESFDFELTGNVVMNWKPGIENLKDRVVGKSKNEVLSIFKDDLGISKASVTIIPFWSKKLPNKVENINVVLK